MTKATIELHSIFCKGYKNNPYWLIGRIFENSATNIQYYSFFSGFWQIDLKF